MFSRFRNHSWIAASSGNSEDIFPTEGQETGEGFSTFDLPALLKPRRKTRLYTHRFRIQGGVNGPFYHAVEPRRVRAPIYRLMLREDNTLNAGRASLGSEYEIDSEISDPSPSDLRGSGTRYPDEIKDRYLSRGTPNTALADLAEEATRGAAANPYDRAQAIRRFISGRCIYTREARAVPQNQDAAVFFLNESKEGYCDLYATSMAILCRYAGIPSRVATGFAPGTVATPGGNVPPIAKGDTRQWYSLKGSDLHAWTEVYFTNYGWIPFDATEDTGGTITPQKTPEPIKKKEGWKELWAKAGLSLVFIGIGILGVLFVLINEFLGRFAPHVAFRVGKQYQHSNEVVNLYLRTVRQVARRGAKRPDTMTPSEYLKYVREQFDPAVAEALQPLTLLTERALYGQDGLSNEETATAYAAVRQVKAALKNHRKPTPAKELVHGP